MKVNILPLFKKSCFLCGVLLSKCWGKSVSSGAYWWDVRIQLLRPPGLLSNKCCLSGSWGLLPCRVCLDGCDIALLLPGLLLCEPLISSGYHGRASGPAAVVSASPAKRSEVQILRLRSRSTESETLRPRNLFSTSPPANSYGRQSWETLPYSIEVHDQPFIE